VAAGGPLLTSTVMGSLTPLVRGKGDPIESRTMSLCLSCIVWHAIHDVKTKYTLHPANSHTLRRHVHHIPLTPIHHDTYL
jgi:hypothetical protein